MIKSIKDLPTVEIDDLSTTMANAEMEGSVYQQVGGEPAVRPGPVGKGPRRIKKYKKPPKRIKKK